MSTNAEIPLTARDRAENAVIPADAGIHVALSSGAFLHLAEAELARWMAPGGSFNGCPLSRA